MKRWSTEDIYFSVKKEDWYGNEIFEELPERCYLDWENDFPVSFSDATIRVSLQEMLERILRDTMPTAQ